MTSCEKFHRVKQEGFWPTAVILRGINNEALIDWSSVISGPSLSPPYLPQYVNE